MESRYAVPVVVASIVFQSLGELKKSPNSAFADDTDNGIACHWYVIE